MTDLVRPERPFNRPTSLAGRLAFTVIRRMEAAVSRYSKVGRGPFFEEDHFPWVVVVKNSSKRVAEEARRVLMDRERLPAFQEISPEVGYITQDRHWKTFMLVGYGLRSPRGLEYCPATAALLKRIPGLRTAFFSILEPGKRLPPHRGPYNGVLRLHLGLVIPKNAEHCWIRVGNERRHWRPGEVVIFDDALEHEVYNETDEPRVVLFVDFLRPCQWPISWLNSALVYLARFSPLVQRAKRETRRWEDAFYESTPPAPAGLPAVGHRGRAREANFGKVSGTDGSVAAGGPRP